MSNKTDHLHIRLSEIVYRNHNISNGKIYIDFYLQDSTKYTLLKFDNLSSFMYCIIRDYIRENYNVTFDSFFELHSVVVINIYDNIDIIRKLYYSILEMIDNNKYYNTRQILSFDEGITMLIQHILKI